jgi:anti-sigma regulatory factor (Ser/Thr protein kinase)
MDVHRLWSHQTAFSAEASSAARARAFVSQHLLGHGMPHLVDDIELVVSELATNAMVHARTPFTVILCAFEETVCLEVSDGSQLEPSVVMAKSLDTSGRGVAIVEALSRDWGALTRASGGKTVWAQFDNERLPCAQC